MTLTCYQAGPDFAAAPPEIAILPLACYEPHGPHLPVGTDLDIMKEISSRVAERLHGPAFLLPVWPIGTSLHHSGQPGTISLSYSTLWAVVTDVITSLHEHGIHKVVVLNNHGSAMTTTARPLGNFIVKTAVRQLNYEIPGLSVIWVQPFAAAREALTAIFPSAQQEIHAGAVETSIFMHFMPERSVTPPPDFIPTVSPAFLDYAPFLKFAPGQIWGCPSESSAVKGQQALEIVVSATVRYIEDAFSKLRQIQF